MVKVREGVWGTLLESGEVGGNVSAFASFLSLLYSLCMLASANGYKQVGNTKKRIL